MSAMTDVGLGLILNGLAIILIASLLAALHHDLTRMRRELDELRHAPTKQDHRLPGPASEETAS